MKRLIFYLVVIFVLTACQTYPYLYHIDKVESMIVKRKIAIIPCNTFRDNKYSTNSIKRLIEDSLKSEFQRNGFEVIELNSIKKDIDSIKSIFGGFYSSETGNMDTSKVNGFRKNIIQHVVKKYGVTSVLFSKLVIVRAMIQNGGYCWDGRYVGSFSLGNRFGQTTALSLYVGIFDVNENLIFDNAGGIQPLAKLQFSTEFSQVKDNEILNDPEDLKKALDIIFKPLNERFNNNKVL